MIYKLKPIVFACLLITLAFSKLSAQKHYVGITASYDSIEHAVLLRWAPSDYFLWTKANQQGYTLEKYIYQRDNQLLNAPREKIILSNALKPAPLDDWEELALKNDYAAVAAQCLYGESIEIQDAPNAIVAIVNKSREQDSRFSFALFAADHSVEVAEKSGLFFKDFQVKKNERYLYVIYPNITDSTLAIDTGSIFYGPKDYRPLNSPRLMEARQEQEHIVLSWMHPRGPNETSSYIIQKAGTDFNFQTINSLPVVNTETGPIKNNEGAVFIDEKPFEGANYYRLLGRNSFGQLSEPSDTFQTQFIPNFVLPQPKIDTVYYHENHGILVNWSVRNGKEFIDKVFLEKSDQERGRYELVKMTEQSDQSTLTDAAPKASNYYRVGIKAGNYLQYSLPYLALVVDSLPPAKPTFSKYQTNDSLVTLHWIANQEQDLAGYRIYKANTKNSEPSLVYEKKSLENQASVVENIKFMHKERFYYLTAFDKVGNTSEMSEPFMAKMVDKIPPSAPHFKKAEQFSDSVKIEWALSSSEDVKSQLLYRKTAKKYELIAVLPANQSYFWDLPTLSQSTLFYYRILALDSAGNEAVSQSIELNFVKKYEQTVEYELRRAPNGYQIFWKVDEKLNKTTLKVYLRNERDWNFIKEVPFKQGALLLDFQDIAKSDLKLIFL